MVIIKEPINFQWDTGNLGKNKKSHNVAEKEAEEVFFDKKKRTFKDHVHSKKEERFRVIGKSKQKRLLFIVFTVRLGRIRIISARDTNRKEVSLYEEKTNTTKI